MPESFTFEDAVKEPESFSFEDAQSTGFKRYELAKQTFEARLEGERGKLGGALADVGTELAKGAVRGLSYVDPTGFSQGLMQQYGVEPTHVISTEAAQRGGEIVSEAAGQGLRALGITHDIIPQQIQKPLQEFAAENIAALPEMLPALAAGKWADPKGIGRLFQAQMLRGVPESAYQAATAETPEERLKAGLNTAAGIAFPAAIEHGIRESSVQPLVRTGKSLDLQRGAVPPVGEPAAPIERVAHEQSALAAERMSAPFEEKLASEHSILTPKMLDRLSDSDRRDLEIYNFGKQVSDERTGGVGTAADEFGAIHGPKLEKEIIDKLNENVGSEWNLESPEGTTTKLQIKPSLVWVKSEQKVPGTSGQYDVGISYLKILPDGTTILNGSTKNRPIDKISQESLFNFLKQGTIEKPVEKPTPTEIVEAEQVVPPTPATEIKAAEKPVLTENGNPLVVYRGGSKTRTENEHEIGIHFGSLDQAKVFESQAAQKVGWENAEIKAVNLAIKNPFIYNGRDTFGQTGGAAGIYSRIEAQLAGKDPADIVTGDYWGKFKEGSTDAEIYKLLRQKLEERGYDSIQYINTQEGPITGDRRAWIVFDDSSVVPVKQPALETVAPKVEEAQAVAPTVDKLQSLTEKIERGEKLTAAETKQYKKLRDEATGAVKEQAKPEVGMGGALAGEKNPKAQIEQLGESFKGVKAPEVPWKEKLKEAFNIGSNREILKEGVSKALSGLKNTWEASKERWNGIEKIDDLLRAKGELSQDLESRGWWINHAVRLMKKAVPRARDQAAIAKWVDSGGDIAKLKVGEAEAPKQFKQAYVDAQNLKGDLLVAAQNARNYFEARLDEAIQSGVLKDGVEDYIHRIYESRPEEGKKVVAMVQSALLQKNPALAKKRVFEYDWEAEKLGYKPVQSFITRVAEYDKSLSKAIAARKFIEKATEMKAPDGRPVIDIKGMGIPIEDKVTGEREGTLIKPAFNPSKNAEQFLPDGSLNPNYRNDYVNKEFPALSRWKWVSADAAGKPIFVHGDVAIHPKYVDRINALLEPSRVRYGRYGNVLRPALDAGASFKSTMLDLSMFHQVQIAIHGMEHKVNPFNLAKDIDFNNPDVNGLLKGGVTLGGDYHASKEGIVGNSITRHVPWIGPILDSYHEWLFKDFIPRMKMTMALKAVERNRARYPGMTEEQIYKKTADQANAAFGEQNYIMLERSKTAQDIARLILLAPDFLESRGRFAGQALAKGGKSTIPGFGNEQRAALLLGALTMYVVARIANKITDDQYHFEPENAFSLVKGNHAYSLRTVQGDILHLLEHPLQFWLNRLNPMYGRPALEIATGRDYFGRKRSVPQIAWDTVSNIVPISLRSSRERTLYESMANSFGINARRYNATDDAFKLARDWKAKNGVQEPGEFIYDSEKDPLRPLKIALSNADDAGAANEIKKVLASGYDAKRLNAYFDRYAKMPFTGSLKNDAKWKKTLDEDQLKTVQAAMEHKKTIRSLYLKALGQYKAARAAGQ